MALNNLTLEEVRVLASNVASCINKTEANVVVLIHPMYAGDVMQGVNKELGSMSSRYSKDLGGIPVAFEKVRISHDGGMFHINPFIHLRVQATFYVFTPEVGSVLEGYVKRKSPNHLSCLVHKTFNVSVPKPHNTPDQNWEGTSLDEGDAVRLVVTEVNMSFHLPMITGRLDGRIDTPAGNAASGGSAECSDKKPPNASVDSGISSEYDEDGEKKIKAVKKKEKKGDKKEKVTVVSKKKGVKDKVKAEKKKKKKKEKEGKEREKSKKEKKKKKKDEKEKKKKDKKTSKKTGDEKRERKEKKKKDKEKKEHKERKKEKKKNKSITEGSEADNEIITNIKIEQSTGTGDEDHHNPFPVIKSEKKSPVKIDVRKGSIKTEYSDAVDAEHSIVDKKIKVEMCNDTIPNTSSTSGFEGAAQFGLEAEIGDFGDDDFFGKRKSASEIKAASKKRKTEKLSLSPSKDSLEVKKRKLDQSPEKSKKKRKTEK